MQPAKPGLPSMKRAEGGKTEQDLERRAHSLSQGSLSLPHFLKAGCYLALNIVSATCIIFANKLLFTALNFRFVYALTLLHVLTTLLGMHLFAALGFYEKKALPFRPLISLAAAFVGYIVFWNVSLQVNPVGFYQLSKICITPAAMAFEAAFHQKYPTRKEIGAIVVLCIGVTLATVTDKQVSANLVGLGVGAAAICTTALYQVLVGSAQKQLEAGSMALMAAYTPIASGMLIVLVPIFEPVGFSKPNPGTLIGYPYTPQAVAMIALTAVLGLLVSLSTFLVIGATSSVTFNVVGHIKTIIIVGGGCLLFSEEMPLKRFLGICLALSGIFWYSALKFQAQSQPSRQQPSPEKEGLLRNRSLNGTPGKGEQRNRSLTSLEAVDRKQASERKQEIA